MRRIRYTVAASLDGYIAGPQGEVDWIVHNPEFGFNTLYAQFDTVLMGRVTYDWMLAHGEQWMPKMETYVFSRSLRQQDHPNVTISPDLVGTIKELRSKEGKDIWLFGGGILFRALLQARLVDKVEVALMPAILGDGIPLLPPPYQSTKLRLTKQSADKSGIVSLEYEVAFDAEAGHV
ncbi:MAG: dihydrofolate reductase family protein [Bryobacterales bacterium]|nr:dihydrofolate reductase family protein [Bryobacterales bacterium]